MILVNVMYLASGESGDSCDFGEFCNIHICIGYILPTIREYTSVVYVGTGYIPATLGEYTSFGGAI